MAWYGMTEARPANIIAVKHNPAAYAANSLLWASVVRLWATGEHRNSALGNYIDTSACDIGIFIIK